MLRLWHELPRCATSYPYDVVSRRAIQGIQSVSVATGPKKPSAAGQGRPQERKGSRTSFSNDTRGEESVATRV